MLSSKTRKLILGVILLLCVDLLTFSSSEVSHYIYTSDEYNKPYFTTYVRTAMFSVFLLGFVFWRPWHRRFLKEFRNSSNGNSDTSTDVLGIVETIKLSCTFSILWFIGTLSYNEALAIAQPAIVNTLTSTSSVFTCILSGIFPFNENDKFTISKLLLSAFGVVGVGFIADSTDSSHDTYQNSTSSSTTDTPHHFSFHDQFLGITWSLVGAAAYSIYLTLTRYKVGENRSLDLPMFFGPQQANKQLFSRGGIHFYKIGMATYVRSLKDFFDRKPHPIPLNRISNAEIPRRPFLKQRNMLHPPQQSNYIDSSSYASITSTPMNTALTPHEVSRIRHIINNGRIF